MLTTRQLRLSILVLAFAAMAVVAVVSLRHVDVRGVVDQVILRVREAGPLAFFTAMALLPAIGFPLAVFPVVAGPVFGPTMGLGAVIACTIAAVSINVALCYWLATRALRPVVIHVLRWLGYTLPEIQPNAAWWVVLLVRVVPGPPFFLQSYLLGVARVPFRLYMLVSVVVPAAYLSGTIVLSDALLRGDRWGVVRAIGIYFTAGAILHQLRRRMKARAAAGPAGEQSERGRG